MVIIENTKSSSDISREKTKKDEESLNTLTSPLVAPLVAQGPVKV